MFEKMGYASFDQPWAKHYKETADSIREKYQGKSIWQVGKELLKEYSDVPMIEYFGNVISRDSFHETIVMWAKALKEMGVQVGEVVPCHLPAVPEAFALFFALNAIGATPYYLKIDISKEDLIKETEHSKVAIVFDALWDSVRDVFQENKFEHIVVVSATDSMAFPMKQLVGIKGLFEKRPDIPRTEKYLHVSDVKRVATQHRGEYEATFQPDRIAVITTSSGTTSQGVKGIMDSNEGVINAMACSVASEPCLRKGSRMFACFPLFASTSLNCIHLLPMFTGDTLVMDPRLDISLWYQQLMKYKPDAALTTGSVWEAFARDIVKEEKRGKKHDLSWSEYFIMGGSGTTPEILEWINTILLERGAQREIKVGYGMSEGFGVLAVEKYDMPFEKTDKDVNSVGKPINGYTLAVFDEKGEELPCGKSLRGELWFKTPANMHGYYGKPELTSQTIIDGWIHSGDYCEMDEKGNVYVYGRMTNAITVSGNKLYLFDLANDLRKHFDLHDVLVEKKNLSDQTEVLNVYFVQKESVSKDDRTLIMEMDSYLEDKGITVSGYKEHEGMLPIDPATLKPRTKDMSGFVKFLNGEKRNISYKMSSKDIYEVLDHDY